MAVTVVIDSTVGGEDANSYASIEQADTLANTRVSPAAAAWRALGSSEAALDTKARALITATRDIDSIPSAEFDFVDEKASDDQALEFPRNTDPTSLPQRLVNATIELALLIQNGSVTTDPLSTAVNNRKKVQSGDDSVEFFEPTVVTASGLDRFPAIVQRLLSSLVIALSSEDAWGTGVVVRTS